MGYRTAVYEGYFYATTEATRTALAGQTNFYSALTTGTTTVQVEGVVTGPTWGHQVGGGQREAKQHACRRHHHNRTNGHRQGKFRKEEFGG